MRLISAVLIVLALATPGRAQYLGCVNLDRVNRRLSGNVVDYTQNHGADRRIYSPILGRPRDLYVYLPPGYNPSCSYPLVVYMHVANVDEHYFVGSKMLANLDEMIVQGKCPPMVVACPDGSYGGSDLFCEPHSLYVNGNGGRFEDYVLQEVIPFLRANFAIRPEREALAFLGTSAGGYGAMSIAIRRRDLVGAVATLGAPLNMRYWTANQEYFEDFNPASYRWNSQYDPNQIIGVFYHGVRKTRAERYIGPVFGDGPGVVSQIIATNPADVLLSTGLRPGELPIYVHVGGRDEWNFDAQDESFAWLAAQQGVEVTFVKDPEASHNARYFREALPCAFLWLGQHILPPSCPVALSVPAAAPATPASPQVPEAPAAAPSPPVPAPQGAP
jgi:pimeloyl-ACP methyl ester carboxylesterase